MATSAIAEAFVRLRADVSTFRAEAQAGIAGSLRGLGGGGALKATAGLIGFSTAAAATGIALKEIIVGFGEFERELDVLQVTSGATAEQMEQISDAAKQLGADVTLPGVSAGDAARSMNELSKAGLSVKDTLAAARGTLQLATAGEIDFGEAAKIASSALNVFGLSGDKASHVADLLAGASIAAQGDMNDMALALQQAGAVSRQAGLSIEQTVGAISLLAKNGVAGSDAGTSLRTTLLRLIPTTKEAKQFTKALGVEIDETRSLGEQLPEVIEQYRAGLAKLNPAMQQVALTQIFGTDAIRAASILFREGAVGLDKMTEAANRQGAANELATAKTKGLLGSFEALKSSLSSLAIELGEVASPALEQYARDLAEVAGGITSLVQTGKDWWDSIRPPPDESGGLSEPINDFLDDVIDFELKLAAPVHGIASLLDDSENEIKEFGGNIRDAVRVQDVEAGLSAQMAAAGGKVGRDFVDGTAAAIKANIPATVIAAQEMVARTAEAGRVAVANAIASAQQSLAGIGSAIAGDIGAIIDATTEEAASSAGSGASRGQSAFQKRQQLEAVAEAQANLTQALKNVPIMREIERIQSELDRMDQADKGTDVRRGLRDAREELAAAQKQIQGAGPLTGAQFAAQRKFLRPFTEGVQDAAKEAKKFNLETRLDKLQNRIKKQTDEISENIENLRDNLESARQALIQSQQGFGTSGLTSSLQSAAAAQKRVVQQGIDDIIQDFNDGLIKLPEMNKRIAKLLEDNKIDYEKAADVLGTAFVRRMQQHIKDATAQGAAIAAGPQDPGAGIRANIVRPSAVLRASNLSNEQAMRAYQAALLEEAERQGTDIEKIRIAVEGGKPLAGPKPIGLTGDSAAEKGQTAQNAPYAPVPTVKTVTRPPAKPGRRSNNPAWDPATPGGV